MSLQSPTRGDAETDGLADVFYPLYRLLFDDSSDFVDDLEGKLTEARMADTVEIYIARALGIGTILGGILWIVGSLLGFALFRFGVLTPDMLSLGIPVSSGQTAALLRALVVPSTVGLAGVVFG